MPAIEFRTFGTVDLHGADGRELHSLLAQPKRVALLAYLCIAQPRGFHRRDTLLGLFWPNADQDHARTSLRKALHVLRQTLGDDVIVSRGDEEVSVDFERVSCDVVVFEESLRSGRIEDALALFRGDLLAGFFVEEAPEFEQWLHSERARLHSSAARAAYSAAEQRESVGDLIAAVSWAQRSLDLADTDERALRKLIELQCRAGDRTAAIKTYETFARHLAAEYETQPSSDTRALIEQIRAGREWPGREKKEKAVLQADFDQPPEFRSITHSAAVGAVEGKGGSGRVRKMLYAVTALAILISGAAIWGWMRPAPPKQVVRINMVIDSTEAMVSAMPWSGRVAISPDGSRLAYIGGPRSQLLIRALDQLHATAVPGTEGVTTPFFSPDGSWVGFLEEWKVRIASINGGPSITVSLDTLTGVAGASWGPDNFIYVDGSRTPGLLRVEAKAAAKPRLFTVVDTANGEIDHTWPDVLPNGKGVLFTVAFDGRKGVKGTISYAIAVADIPSGKHHGIVDDAVYARYASSGHLLYVTANKTLMVAPFDQNSMKITGQPYAVTEGMRLGVLGSADLAVSATGTLVYATGGGEGAQELVWVTRDGKAQAVDPDWTGAYMGFPALSPDGKWLAVARNGSPGSVNFISIWIKRLDRGPSRKLTLDGTDNYGPAWKPDGRSVTFNSPRATGTSDLWTTRAVGGTRPVLQLHEKGNSYNPRWTPDGQWLLFQTDDRSPGAGDILAIRPGVDTAPVPVVASRFSEISPALSPNGRWLAYVSNETGADEIYVVPFPNRGTAAWPVSTGGGTEPLWSHRGSELFYRDASGNLRAVKVNTGPTFSLGPATVLFPAAGFTYLRFSPQYAVSLDDRRFLFVRPLETSTHDKLIVVENWFEELKAKSRK